MTNSKTKIWSANILQSYTCNDMMVTINYSQAVMTPLVAVCSEYLSTPRLQLTPQTNPTGNISP